MNKNYTKVGTAEYMPGTEGFTMVVFKTSDVPYGKDVFVMNNCTEKIPVALEAETNKEEKAIELLKNLALALDTAYISSWQSTTAWSKELEAALKFLGVINLE